MYSKIVQLCYRGEPRSDQAIASDAGVFGVLSMVWWQGRPRMNCQAWGITNEHGRLLPALHHVRLIDQNGAILKYDGIQRTRMSDGSFSACYQQWLVEVLGLKPPDTVGPSWPQEWPAPKPGKAARNRG
jgi:hypothetical protein